MIIHSPRSTFDTRPSSQGLLLPARAVLLVPADAQHAETSMLALYLLQSSLVHVNTLLLQQVLAEPKWAKKLTDEDRRRQQTVRHRPRDSTP
ncbi:hypothetical protein [Streptomyces sp. Inha503]|uniref:hypothetical protein n=1 Tax=Streptomyces sp. Inha503 TaxID=3383314 RepID=UPI0039A2D073